MRVAPRAVIVSASERAASFGFGQRLHQPKEFSAVIAAKKVVRGERFQLHYRHASTEIDARLGLIVPKRLARAASLRNAIKRQGREAFRLMAGGIPGYEMVLRLVRPLAGVKATDGAQKKLWRAEIETLLMRLPKTST